VKKAKEIDASAIRYNLSLTPQQRLEQHQAALRAVLELEKAHRKLYAGTQSNPKNPN
jgi:hypothetical protein